MAILKSIQILHAIATYYDYEIWQIDVKTIFFNGNLEKDISMTQLGDLFLMRGQIKYAG